MMLSRRSFLTSASAAAIAAACPAVVSAAPEAGAAAGVASEGEAWQRVHAMRFAVAVRKNEETGEIKYDIRQVADEGEQEAA